MCAALALALAACEFPRGAARQPCAPDGSCSDGHVCLQELCVPEPATCATAVTAGDRHTCALRADRTAWCWGRNDAGQLGDGTLLDRTEPVQVAGTTRFTSIAAGVHHTCGVDEDRTVWCWGGDPSRPASDASASATPSPVADLPRITQVAVGLAHRCALRDDGTVACWGANDLGQLGNGGTAPSSAPTPVANLGGVQELVVGWHTACAIDASGALSCWGNSSGGQLGGFSRRMSPVPVMPEAGPIAHVALGEEFLCALTTAGAVLCAGANSQGQLGYPPPSVNRPVVVALPVPAETITAGARFACATERRDDLHDPPRVWCWGEDDRFQHGDGVGANHSTPTASQYADTVATSAGSAHLCGLSTAGGITCSGDKSHGQLGDGVRTSQGTPPPPIDGPGGVTSISAGNGHTCAVAGGAVLCWGRNQSGQLGDGSVVDHGQPMAVQGVEDAIAVAAGADHSCALLADRTAMCWGANPDGQLGAGSLGELRAVPAPVVESDGTRLADITQLVAGGAHTCALIGGDSPGGGTVKCWGRNNFGQVGITPPICVSCASPVLISSLPGTVEIAAGRNHSCAIAADRTLRCWGSNELGELGNNSLMPSSAPVVVGVPTPLQGVEHVASHGDFTCALTTGGIAQCWGRGNDGQLGDGTQQGYRAPGPLVSGVSGATRIAAGGMHACVLAGSEVKCWGGTYTGQVGAGQYHQASAPVAVALDGTPGAIELTGGERHTCALLGDATVTCWGDNRDGQLGDGHRDRRSRVAPKLPCP